MSCLSSPKSIYATEGRKLLVIRYLIDKRLCKDLKNFLHGLFCFIKELSSEAFVIYAAIMHVYKTQNHGTKL